MEFREEREARRVVELLGPGTSAADLPITELYFVPVQSEAEAVAVAA